MRVMKGMQELFRLKYRVKFTNMAYTCAVKDCSNGAYWLNKWKKQLCDVCGCLHKDKMCSCEPPFRIFAFPTRKYDAEMRNRWQHLVGRQKSNKMWSPSKDSRVCSRHFKEGKPTPANPLPCLHMGYDGAEQRVRRMSLFEATKHTPTQRVRKILLEEDIRHDIIEIVEDPELENITATQSQPINIHWTFVLYMLFIGLLKETFDQRKEIDHLKKEITSLKASVYKLKNKVYCEDILQNNDDVNFYTGIPSLSLFNKLHAQIAQYVTRRWTGAKRVLKNVRSLKKSSRFGHKFGPNRKLTSKSEFLMMLMKLRLGLLSKDLAKRFDISETLCSRIFFAWLRAASIVLRSMIFIPDEEKLIGSKPERFRKLKTLHSIIDCTELFIETPKDLYLQSATWSDYKHHNTLKLLVSCAPNSSIIFVSSAYLGRVSDKALTLDCGYLDLVPPNYMIMADKGFNIGDDCAERSITLYVPPGRRGHSQMTSEQVSSTKTIANHRILIEQVIRRLKTFRILANEIPITIISHIDDIVTVCAAVCNIKKPIYKF